MRVKIDYIIIHEAVYGVKVWKIISEKSKKTARENADGFCGLLKLFQHLVIELKILKQVQDDAWSSKGYFNSTFAPAASSFAFAASASSFLTPVNSSAGVVSTIFFASMSPRSCRSSRTALMTASF